VADPAKTRDFARRAAARVRSDVETFRAHPWYGIERGWIFTFDEHPPPGVPSIRPLPKKEYLKAICDLWMENDLALLEKSRQLMISWIFSYLCAWDAWTKYSRHNIFQGKRQEDVNATGDKGLLGRARFMRDHLPPHLRPKVSGEATTYETYTNGSTLEALPEGKDKIRSKVISVLFMDELGFHDEGEASLNTALPAARGGGKVWGISTPNGHDFIYNQHAEDMKWEDWRKWPALKGMKQGLTGYKNSTGMLLLALHYSADPTKDTPEARALAKQGYTNIRMYLRENELDFSTMAGKGIWANEFHQDFHVIPRYVPDPTAPIYRGWDTGYTGQAVCFAQRNSDGQLVLFDQIIEKHVALPQICRHALQLTEHWRNQGQLGHLDRAGMDGRMSKVYPSTFDYGDPATKQHNSKGETDVSTLAKYGIQLVSQTTKNRKFDLIEQPRQLLLPRSDGKPALVIARNSPNMDHVVQMFAGAYAYKDVRPGQADTGEPHKDGWYDHIADSIQYLIDNVSPITYGAPADEANMEWWKDYEPGVGNDYNESNDSPWAH
jgi:hypothetical protein